MIIIHKIIAKKKKKLAPHQFNLSTKFCPYIYKLDISDIQYVSRKSHTKAKQKTPPQNFCLIDSDSSLYRASLIASWLLRGIFYSAFFAVNRDWLVNIHYLFCKYYSTTPFFKLL